MVPIDAEPPREMSLDRTLAAGTALGKRYSDEGSSIEVLCTKAGPGTLTIDDRPLAVRGAKPLPSSD